MLRHGRPTTTLAVGAAIPVPAARRFTIPEADGLRDRVHGL
jgi:hypothetical protein